MVKYNTIYNTNYNTMLNILYKDLHGKTIMAI